MKLQKIQNIHLFENHFIILKWNTWNTFVLTQWHRNIFVAKRKVETKPICKFTIEEFNFNFYMFPTLWRTHCIYMLSLLSPSLWVPLHRVSLHCSMFSHQNTPFAMISNFLMYLKDATMPVFLHIGNNPLGWIYNLTPG